MTPNVLENLRNAREELRRTTGVRVLLVGDPEDEAPSSDSIGSNNNLVWFKITQHLDPECRQHSIAKHTDHIRALVGENLDAILLQGVPKRVVVRITFDGYESDPRELYEVAEVRDWMRKVFIEGVPQGLALLDPQTFSVARTCINKILTSFKTVGPRGSPARTQYEMTPEWLIACYLAGINAETEGIKA